MPHADNRPWMELLLGELPTAPRRLEVADLVASRQIWDLTHLNQNLPPKVECRDQMIHRQGDGGEFSAELYTPIDIPARALMLYLHGGGWCAGSVANERQIAMRFAALGIEVLSPEYRLAPEHPFPAAVDDCIDAARWLTGHNDSDESVALLLAGQSAGANLAAAVALALSPSHDSARPLDEDTHPAPMRPQAALLMCGIYSFPLLLESPGSNIGPAELWHQAYLGPDFLRRSRDDLVSPMFANLGDFPPTYLSCGDEDSLLGQTLEFAQRLTSHDVATTVSVTAGLNHGFPFIEDLLPQAQAEMRRTRQWVTETTTKKGHQ